MHKYVYNIICNSQTPKINVYQFINRRDYIYMMEYSLQWERTNYQYKQNYGRCPKFYVKYKKLGIKEHMLGEKKEAYTVFCYFF